MRPRSMVLAPVALAVTATCAIAGCQAFDRTRYEQYVDAGATDAGDVALVDVRADTNDAAADTMAPLDAPLADVMGDERGAEDVVDAVDVVVPPPDVAPDVIVDAGLDRTSCDDTNVGALFCDGFEDGVLAAWSATSTVSGSVSVATAPEPVYRGTRALRAETTAPSGRAEVFTRVLGMITSGDLYFRAYYYFPSSTTLQALTFLSISEPTAPYDRASLEVDTGNHIAAYLNTGGGILVSGAPLAVATPDRWMCLSMHVHIGAMDGSVEFFADGIRIGTRTGINTLPAGGYGSFDVGINYTSMTQPAAVLYVDEAVVSSSPIPCD